MWARGAVGALVLCGPAAGCGDAQGRTEAPPAPLVFVSDRDSVRGVFRIDPGSAPRRLSPPSRDEVPLAVSPDGRALVVGRTVRMGGRSLEQLVVWEDGDERVLTPPRSRARHPVWSPDGEWIVFESDLEGFSDLYRVGRAGGDIVRLTDDPEGNFEPSVSPDGRHIVFASSRDQQAEVYRSGSDGAEPRRLPGSPRDEWRVRWSPSGEWIALLSNARGRDELYLMRPDGTARRRLNETREDGGRADLLEAEPAWSPDGTALLYTTRSRDGERRIWRVDLADGRHRPLTEADAPSDSPVWSPDGRHIAFVAERDGNADVYVMGADGARPIRVTASPAQDWMPRWVPAAP